MLKFRYPQLRQGLAGAWCPSLGATGLTLPDRSVRGNHGTLTSGPTWQASGSGIAINFDGTDDYVGLPAIASPTAFPLTMCAWFRSTSTTLTQCIFSFGHPTLTDRHIGLYAAGATAGDPVQLFTRNSSSSVANSTTGYVTNTWTFACGVIYSNTDKRAYINGGSEATETTSVTIPTTSQNSIGRLFRGSAANLFSGQIDDVSVFNRALSLPEINLLYSAGRGAIHQIYDAPVVRGFTTAGTTVTPTTASLTLTTFAPTVTATANQVATPDTAALTLTTFAPTADLSSANTVTPGTATLSLTTYDLTVTATANLVATPDAATLSLSAFAPTITTANASVTATPTTATLTLTTYAPSLSSVGQSWTITFVGNESCTGELTARTTSGGITATTTTGGLTISELEHV